MAIVVHTTPSGGLNLIGNPVVFEFAMTDVDNGTEVRRFGYQLYANGNPISALESISPKEGERFIIDFQRDIRPFIYTNTPQCYQLSRDEPEMVIEISLKFWEFVYNKDECTTTIENEDERGPYKIINSTNQYWGYTNNGAQSFFVLNLKPKNVFICKDQCDLIYIYDGQINVDYYYDDGSFALGQGAFSTDGVKSFRISADEAAEVISNAPVIGGTPPTKQEVLCRLHKANIRFDNTHFITYYFTDCCCSRTIWFQQSQGGYSSMGFDCDDSLAVQSTFTEVCRFQPVRGYQGPGSSDIRTKGGLSITNKTSYKQITLTKDLHRDDIRDLRYYEDFLSSGSYYYEFTNFDGMLNDINGFQGFTQMVKFIPNAGSIRYYKKDDIYRLVITGKINQPHQMPVYAI